MPEQRAAQHALPHAVFLDRLTQESEHSAAAWLGQGAFLALRLVDLLAVDRGPVTTDAFRYQYAATERFCRDLRRGSAEEAHIKGLVQSAADAHHRGDVRLVTPALLAYALYLEDDERYEEALDILDTLLHVGGDGLGLADAVAVRLRLARVSRKLARFEEAETQYAQAGELAAAASDGHSVLLSRIGHAISVQSRGNLAEAERLFRDALADARGWGERDPEARAEHALATTLHLRGQPTEAIPHAWRAFELYEDESPRLRALNDVGIMLLAIGDTEGAERALTEVVRRCAAGDNVHNAMTELMHCASYRRDRVGFERWRAECEAHFDRMAPNIAVDFLLKVGIGRARFGRLQAAEELMTKALSLATKHGLHEFEFRIERIKNGLRECRGQLTPLPAEPAEPVTSEQLRGVRASLSELATAGA